MTAGPCQPRVRCDALLSEYTTFKLGGPCPSLITCVTSAELEAVLSELNSSGTAYLLTGGGSNLLISDEGVDITLVRFVGDEAGIVRDGLRINVSGSTSLDRLAERMVDEELDGLMCCTGIPGTVGGAIVGNAGAWGKQVGDVLESVELIDPRGRKRRACRDELGFAYRTSSLKETSDVVLSARFVLTPGDRSRQADERVDILRKRAERHPDLNTVPCIGSIFRNMEPTSSAGRRQAAGWFLEQAGAKQMSVGGAKVFERHANIIVKGEGCTAQDVRDLAVMMKDAVRKKFGIELVREVRFLGRFEGEEVIDPPTFF